MSRNLKTVKKTNKKSVKKIITEMNIIDGIKNNDLTGLVNCDTIDTVVELCKKIGHTYVSTITRAIEDEKCAQKFYDIMLNYKYVDNDEYGLMGHNLFLLMIDMNAIGENVIHDDIYNRFYARKYIIINSLNSLIDLLCHHVSYENALNYLKKNFREEMFELSNSASYKKVLKINNKSFENTKSCRDGDNEDLQVPRKTEVILRMFNANPK